METSKNSKLIWFPRILAILFILFLSLFALDVWSAVAPFWTKLWGFLIHLIPSFVLLIALAISWRCPAAGGVIFMLIALIFTVWFRTYTALPAFLTISGIPFVAGLLFCLGTKK